MYAHFAIESGGPVLELGVGTGRVAIPTARLGVDVAGVDSSAAMLEVAARKLAALNPPPSGKLELVQGDMRDFDLRDDNGDRRKFPLATIPFRGFLALMTADDQIRALRNIRRHLTPDGLLVFNIFVPDPNMALETGDVPRHLADVTDADTGITRVLYQQSAYDFHAQIASIRMIIEELDESGVMRPPPVPRLRPALLPPLGSPPPAAAVRLRGGSALRRFRPVGVRRIKYGDDLGGAKGGVGWV